MRLQTLSAAIGALIFASTNAFSAPPATTTKPVSPLIVVDSAGKTVGRFGYLNQVYIDFDGMLFAAQIGNRDTSYASGLDFGQLPIYFQTTDCTGTAFIDVYSFGVRSAVVAMVGGLGGQKTAFVSSGDLPSQTSWQSSLNWNGSGYGCAVQASPQVRVLAPATGVDFTGLYAAPFFVR